MSTKGITYDDAYEVAAEFGYSWGNPQTVRNWLSAYRKSGKMPKVKCDGKGHPTEASLRAALRAHVARRNRT